MYLKLRGKFVFWQLVMNFHDFWQNSVIYQKKKEKKTCIEKYQLWRKFIFWQLVVNFADFRWNNSVIIQKIVLQGNFIFDKWSRKIMNFVTYSIYYTVFSGKWAWFVHWRGNQNIDLKKVRMWKGKTDTLSSTPAIKAFSFQKKSNMFSK